ncbi:MAG: NUDIX domain-containing protein [Nanoarchaeota archaeon]
MKKERSNLPFRINCEGYFTDSKGNILAYDTGKGYIVFPGGGVNNNESPEEGLIRETFEETGAIVGDLSKLGVLKIVWWPEWAKTKEQKKRYELFQGEEMHFFKGFIKEFKNSNLKEKDHWKGDKLMPIKEVIWLIEKNKPFSKGEKEYREAQLMFLKNLLSVVS